MKTRISGNEARIPVITLMLLIIPDIQTNTIHTENVIKKQPLAVEGAMGELNYIYK